MVKIVKQAAIDIVITAFVLLVVLVNNTVLDIILVILTVLLLLARLSVLSNKEMSKQLSKKQSNVPEWFYHVLNGLNIVFLMAGQRFLLAVAWGVIWFLSWKTLQSSSAKKQ